MHPSLPRLDDCFPFVIPFTHSVGYVIEGAGNTHGSVRIVGCAPGYRLQFHCEGSCIMPSAQDIMCNNGRWGEITLSCKRK